MYFVKKLHKPDSLELKLMAYDLYPLLPSLKPCKSVETTDTRYIHWRKLYILNYTMRNGLTNNFKPRFHFLLINMIILWCQLHPFLLLYQWLNFKKKVTLVPPTTVRESRWYFFGSSFPFCKRQHQGDENVLKLRPLITMFQTKKTEKIPMII